ncbi:unnamed protein product [Dovyalis caffra]|uniref:Uncharacterized protein n=1 Tax=Dovyalis caffra TaxID=77055 RepID=A0AAV1QZ07_9ROSI|nr:unnamed protein product [Dovyalis caffra]
MSDKNVGDWVLSTRKLEAESEARIRDAYVDVNLNVVGRDRAGRGQGEIHQDFDKVTVGYFTCSNAWLYQNCRPKVLIKSIPETLLLFLINQD